MDQHLQRGALPSVSGRAGALMGGPEGPLCTLAIQSALACTCKYFIFVPDSILHPFFPNQQLKRNADRNSASLIDIAGGSR